MADGIAALLVQLGFVPFSLFFVTSVFNNVFFPLTSHIRAVVLPVRHFMMLS